MSKTLAIKGRETQGIEVIKLLEMMGGKNCFHLHGLFSEHAYYFIGGPRNDEIRAGEYIFDEDDMCFFTLEEFWERFPFKVGDRVRIPEYESEVRICQMKWDPYSKYIEYMVYRNEAQEWYTTEELLNWNDNPNETTDCKKCGLHFGSVQCFDKDCPINTPKDMEEKKINQMSLANCDLDEVEIVLGDKFELQIKDGKYYAVRKKPKYPKTYEECCKNYPDNEKLKIGNLLCDLEQLIICRNAYWKIAGKEMGLGKPWEPNWTTFEGVPAIFRFRYNIVCDTIKNQHCLLVFPTEEMRDTFYKNFKDLIEQCKELL